MYNMYIHLSGRRVCHFCNKSSSTSTRYRTGFNLAYVLVAAKLIIVDTWEEGARWHRQERVVAVYYAWGGGDWNHWGGGKLCPPAP